MFCFRAFLGDFYSNVLLYCQVFEEEVVDDVVEDAVLFMATDVVGDLHDDVFKLDNYDFVGGAGVFTDFVEPDCW